MLAAVGAAATAAAAALLATARCGGEPEEKLEPGQVALALDSLPPGQRVVTIVAGNPVELVRTGDRVAARSLRCTHTGCVVRWREELRQYVCPCHEGRYSEDGQVLAGPPPLPLRPVAVTSRKGRVVVG
jgi:Rieske Fe-S protein